MLWSSASICQFTGRKEDKNVPLSLLSTAFLCLERQGKAEQESLQGKLSKVFAAINFED